MAEQADKNLRESRVSISEPEPEKPQGAEALRQVSRQQLRREILGLVEDEPGIGYLEMALRLKVSLRAVAEVADELVQEGELARGEVSATD